MPDLLLLSSIASDIDRIEKACVAQGFRVKSTADAKIATEWIELREFAAAIVDLATPIETQQKLADVLWKKDPLAPFIAYDLSPTGRAGAQEMKLYGAQIVRGDNALSAVEQILGSLKIEQDLRNQEFGVMVVEDLDSPRDIICFYLESMGFSKVTGFPSAKQALDALAADPKQFSCIITDIRMPEVSGDKLIEMLRADARYKHLPIIVLTAHGTTDCLIECLKAGASGFLVKPPKKADLTRELRRAQRLSASGSEPRLAKPDEVELIRQLIVDQGLA